jgi:hypothetical protein
MQLAAALRPIRSIINGFVRNTTDSRSLLASRQWRATRRGGSKRARGALQSAASRPERAPLARAKNTIKQGSAALSTRAPACAARGRDGRSGGRIGRSGGRIVHAKKMHRRDRFEPNMQFRAPGSTTFGPAVAWCGGQGRLDRAAVRHGCSAFPGAHRPSARSHEGNRSGG